MNDLTSLTLWILIGFVVVFLLAISLILRRIASLTPPETDSSLLLLQQQIDALRDQVRSSLEGGREELDRRLQETNRIVGDVRRGLGAVDKQVRTVNESARGLRDLQELLRSPTVRGGIGEYMLGELLAQTLPKARYRLQHEFGGGERVDAVIELGEGLVPVDAKFPLDNFRRLRQAEVANDEAELRAARRAFRMDVRRHVDAIAKRYIRPAEGTYEFAMMYIPAEAVYQELLHQDGDDGLDMLHYAMSRRVVPVSPQSFYAYLQIIVFGLRGMSIESQAREIMNRLGDIRTRLQLFGESFDIVGKHLGNAQRQMDEAGRRLTRVDAAVEELSHVDRAAETALEAE
ncbi:MAG: DNA recombination protein RmuC [bacterium]|nr:DNA recombination protein RmuC [bacterium]